MLIEPGEVMIKASVVTSRNHLFSLQAYIILLLGWVEIKNITKDSLSLGLLPPLQIEPVSVSYWIFFSYTNEDYLLGISADILIFQWLGLFGFWLFKFCFTFNLDIPCREYRKENTPNSKGKQKSQICKKLFSST